MLRICTEIRTYTKERLLGILKPTECTKDFLDIVPKKNLSVSVRVWYRAQVIYREISNFSLEKPREEEQIRPTEMATMVNMNNLLNGKDSRWLQLEVCREFQRNKCSRPDTECKFAHPPANVEVQNGRVTACYDSIKVRISFPLYPIHLPKKCAVWDAETGYGCQRMRDIQLGERLEILGAINWLTRAWTLTQKFLWLTHMPRGNIIADWLV